MQTVVETNSKDSVIEKLVILANKYKLNLTQYIIGSTFEIGKLLIDLGKIDEISEEVAALKTLLLK